MEWATLIVKLHQMSISYGTRSSHTCMSKQGALLIRKKRIGERTTSSGIHYWMKNMSYVKIEKSKEHRTEAKIWSTWLSRFRWYVWISTDQLMSCLKQAKYLFAMIIDYSRFFRVVRMCSKDKTSQMKVDQDEPWSLINPERHHSCQWPIRSKH